MSKLLLSLIAVSVLLPAQPLSAQNNYSPISRMEKLETMIDVGDRERSLSASQASRLRARVANLKRLEWRYRRNGLSKQERIEIRARYNDIRLAIINQRYDRQKRHSPR